MPFKNLYNITMIIKKWSQKNRTCFAKTPGSPTLAWLMSSFFFSTKWVLLPVTNFLKTNIRGMPFTCRLFHYSNMLSEMKVDHGATASSLLSDNLSWTYCISSKTNSDKIKVTEEITGVWALKMMTSKLQLLFLWPWLRRGTYQMCMLATGYDSDVCHAKKTRLLGHVV